MVFSSSRGRVKYSGQSLKARVLRACKLNVVFSRLSSLEMATPAVAAPGSQQPNVLETAGRLVDEHIQSDGRQLELSAQLKIATHSEFGGTWAQGRTINDKILS